MTGQPATERLAQLVLYCLAFGVVLCGAWVTLCGALLTLAALVAVFARYL